MDKPKFDTCFFERYAMITLRSILGEHYAHLQNADRPDLQDLERSIGIEVTRAIKENKIEAEWLVNEMAGAEIFNLTELDKQRTLQYGYSYGLTDGQYMGELERRYWSLALPLKRIIKNKVQKVSDGFYGSFNEFGLYIFSKDNLNELEIRLAVDYTTDLQRKNKIRYSQLYISQINKLSVCDLHTGTITEHCISADQCNQFYCAAVE